MALTTRAQLRKPNASDPAHIGSAIGNPTDDADKYVIPVYLDVATRDDANPAPLEGQMCYVDGGSFGSSLGRSLQVWNGTRWAMISPRLYAVKSVTTSRATTTSATDDPHLIIPLQANAAYSIHYTLLVSGSTTGDAKYQVKSPSGSTSFISCFGPGTTWGASTFEGVIGPGPMVQGGEFSGFVAMGCTDASTPLLHVVHCFVHTGNTAGNASLQWAQNASSVTGTELRGGSYVYGKRLDR